MARKKKSDLTPNYPVIAVYAVDWAGSEQATTSFSTEDLKHVLPIEAWIVGLLVGEDKEHVKIAQQYFPETGNHRCPIAIAKSTIKHRIDYK